MIGRAEALAWLERPLADLLREAQSLRPSRRLTYSRKVFLPVTNLCRDRCSYCTFRKSSRDPKARTMSPDDIRAECRRAAAARCKEALMCLGDRPETAYPSYGRLLESYGAASTAHYVERACRLALEEGLLPHTNAGVLTRDEMRLLQPVNVSLGLMLENVSDRLCRAGGPHASAPDKRPEVRLQMLREAGELQIPFTTGLLVGIGETAEERIDTLLTIRDLSREYGHIQETIVQPFREKPGTPMAGAEQPDDEVLAQTLALGRLILGEGANLQAPPNLSPQGHRLLIRAGLNDWGGISPVTRDFINPEAPWPHLAALAATCAEEGFVLAERLAVYPEHLHQVHPDLQARVRAVNLPEREPCTIA